MRSHQYTRSRGDIHEARQRRWQVGDRLMGDVIEWSMTPMAKEIGDKELIVLLAIADRTMQRGALMQRFKRDDCDLYDRLCRITGLNRGGLKELLKRMAARGLEVRVVFRHDKNGEPVYACKGHSMDFRLPDLPASVQFGDAEACG